MESWSYVSGGKESVANGTISRPGSSLRSNNCLMGWELNTPYSFGNDMLVSDHQTIQNQSYREFGIQELVGQPFPNNPVQDVSSSRYGSVRVMNPIMPTQNTSFGEDESTTKLSISGVDSNSSRDLSLIDLNLGRYVGQRDVHSSKFSHGAPILSSFDSSKPLKRVRSATACCQVSGCNKDLSSSKDYHKRHKVCEVHSKAAKVTLNGIERRFCQQCSRFHLLSEFDDGKRSCRKRLAGHNERRRKPQVSIHSGRTAKLLQSNDAFAGCRFQGTTLTMPSFVFQDLLPKVIFLPDKSGTNDWSMHKKVEDVSAYKPRYATPITNGNVYSKSFFPHYDFDKVIPSLHDKEANAAIESIFSLNSTRFPHDLGGPNSVSSPLFQDTTLGSEDFTVFDTGSTIQGLSGISESGCALSLMSPKSQNSSSHLSGIPMARPLVITGSNTHYSLGQVSEKLIAISSRASTSGVSNKFSSSGNYSVEGSNLGSILMSDSRDAANFDVSNRIYRRSDFMNSKDQLSCEDGATTDLLQLSSQLERVEHQRQSMQVKDENDSFFCLRIT